MNKRDDFHDEENVELQHHDVKEAEKFKPQAVPRIGFTDVAAGAGVAGAAVVFTDDTLHARVSGDVEDPWGTDEDLYDIPAAITRADDEERDRDRKRNSPMALRASGTRGGGNNGAAGASPMMGAPGATVGGVGGSGVGSAPVGSGLSSAGVSTAQFGATQSASVGSMPVTMLQGTQSTTRAASSSAFAPSAGGPQAAGSAGPAVYDPEFIREALKNNGFTTDSDEPNGRGPQTALGQKDSGADQTASDASSSSYLNRPSTFPAPASGAGTSQSGSGAYSAGGAAPRPSGNEAGGSTSGTGASTGPSAASTSGDSVGGSTATLPHASSGSGSRSNSSSATTQAAGSYSGASAAGMSGYSVNSSDLRRESRQWSEVSDLAQPVADAILAAPDAKTMFGHMTTPVSAYSQAVEQSMVFVQESSSTQLDIAERLSETAENFESQEENATQIAGRMMSR